MNNQQDIFSCDVSRHIWDSKYRYRDSEQVYDQRIEDTWKRVAATLAGNEADQQAEWQQRFYQVLQDFRFLPGGRILAGAGAQRHVTLFNCFVMGLIDDSIDGIFDALKEGAITMQQGGGVGYDFSTLRPMGTPARSVGGVASGPVSFMQIWDSMCATLLSTGARRGAMMACLRCDHPDIETFVRIKQNPNALRHFNLSVLISDAFMQAVQDDAEWPLLFPIEPGAAWQETDTSVISRVWSGTDTPVACRILRRIRARELWQEIMQATYHYAEPGVLFIDRINSLNNLAYRETISATNPCGEIPLPPYGACNLGSINLTCFIKHPFSAAATLDMAALQKFAAVATRMLDNVIDLSAYPLDRQQEQATKSRRIGLGLTGLADALLMLGLRYGDEEACARTSEIMRCITYTAYRTSVSLAREKGAFPWFDKEKYLESAFIKTLPQDIQAGIAQAGIRNSHLTAIAPTGTISLLANNISSGLEPVFDFEYQRKILQLDGTYTEFTLQDYASAEWQVAHQGAPLPDHFVDARHVRPEQHLAMQAAIQPFVDNAISKTINVPQEYPFTEFESLYWRAYTMGLKGCTTFRPNPVTGEVLTAADDMVRHSHCCSIEREAD